MDSAAARSSTGPKRGATAQQGAELQVHMLLPAARHLKGLGGMWPHEAPLGPWQQHGGPEQQACDIREDVCKCVF